MADQPSDRDALVTQFCSLTGAAPNEAQQYLATNQWDLSSAAAEYYMSIEEAADEIPTDDTESDDASPNASRGGHVLGDSSAPQPIPTTSSVPPPPSASNSKQPQKKKFATLGDLGGGGTSHAGHSHEGDDNDDPENHDLFTGGEKSGLAVQNPDDLKRKILERAKKNARRPGGDDTRVPQSRFTGTARTLGGDDTPSQIIEDPTTSTPRRAPPVERHLHFWADGFSVDDGPLYRSDDPANGDYLAMIRQGRAPLAIMGVEQGQEVDVKLEEHQEKYKPPKKKYKPFSGGGQRLGSPTPAPGNSGSSEATISTQAAAPSASTTPASTVVQVNESEPTVSLQIRLGDGTRLVSRFNPTHTIGDVYSFVGASSPSSQNRSWTLMTTFPNKELNEKGKSIGDLPELKRGGVVVQKWQ